MKIIKKGKIPPPPNPTIYRGKCDYCKTEMEAIEKELEKEGTSLYGYNTVFRFHAKCILCGHKTDFKEI